MNIEIKDGKFIITGELQPPVKSKSGKTYVVATTHGLIPVSPISGKDKGYSVSLNIVSKEQ